MKRNYNPQITNKISLNNNDKNDMFDTKKKLNMKSIKETIEKSKNIMARDDEELNNLPYKFALKYDHRTYCEYYFSLIRTKHIFVFSFFNNKDYNARIIKIDLFFIGFVIYYSVNALFFNDETMHKIYEDKGSFNFIYQLPQIIYSSLISLVLNTLLKLLALSEDGIIKFKSNKNKEDLNKRSSSLYNILRIKFVVYFSLGFIFLLFFGYYLSMFGAIYVNTQIHLIKDILISFGLSLFYPFIIYLLPGLFRMPSLSYNKNNRNYLYTISKVLQML